jgi:xylose isomerase
MIVGSVHSVCYLETLYWLDRCGYSGWLSMDQYPYREDAAGAIGESILWLRQFQAILEQNRGTIDNLLQQQDAIATSRFLRSIIAPASVVTSIPKASVPKPRYAVAKK